MSTQANMEIKRKSLANDRAEVKDAYVIANYGDAGLDEDYHFDILSRFVIVALAPERVPTKNKWMTTLALVARPKSLWINVEGTDNNPSTQKRSDSIGNLNVGSSNGYTVSGIPRINNDYRLGEIIKIKKIPTPYIVGKSSVLTSITTTLDATNSSYGTWHTEYDAAYIGNDSAKVTALREKPLALDNNGNFYIKLNKYQYEAFALKVMPTIANTLVKIFAKTLAANHPVYSANGGYLFNSVNSQGMYAIEYEDINVGEKQRVATSDCMPLIVATPNTFPTPKTRAIGTIEYSPTYSPISTE